MSTKHWKGASMPDAGDDLLAAWRDYTDTAGIMIPAQSVAAARSTLSRAITGGASVTPSNPAYFDIQGNVYRADGSKSQSGAWVLRLVNETETGSDTYRGEWHGSLKQNEFSDMVRFSIPARPYDRLLTVTANAYGRCEKGRVDLAIVGPDNALSAAQFAPDTESSVSTILMMTVSAGGSPEIQVGVRGAFGGGTVALSSQSRLNTVVWKAEPITMM